MKIGMSVFDVPLLVSTFTREAQPGPSKGQPYLFGGAKSYSAPEKNEFDGSAIVPALGLGYALSVKWSAEPLCTRFDVDYQYPGEYGEDITELVWANFFRIFGGNDQWQPFLNFGAGNTNSGRGSLSSANDTQLINGLSIYRRMNDRSLLRGDVGAIYSNRDNNIQPFASFGLTAVLGKTSKGVFPVATPPADANREGIEDGQDKCPGTPAGVIVERQGCALDGDADGVPDYPDACPDTAASAKVDRRGCYQQLEKSVRINLNLEFDTNSANLRPAHSTEIQQVVELVREYPDRSASIEGHTDDSGDGGNNQQLSEQRTLSELNYLAVQPGFDARRLPTPGLGEAMPIAWNEDRKIDGCQSSSRQLRW